MTFPLWVILILGLTPIASLCSYLFSPKIVDYLFYKLKIEEESVPEPSLLRQRIHYKLAQQRKEERAKRHYEINVVWPRKVYQQNYLN